MEVCCGENSGLAGLINEKGGKAFRVGLFNGMDLSTPNGLKRAKEFMKIVKPRWLWLSPICGPTSPVQNLNQKDDKQIRNLQSKVRRSRKIARSCIELARDHVSKSGHFGWEWPWLNGGWKFPEMVGFEEWLGYHGLLNKVRLDGCQVGVVAHDVGKPMLKPWKILSSDPHMCRSLDRRCDGNHEHAECLGGSRTHKSEFYPRKMCDIITRVVMENPQEILKEDLCVFMNSDIPQGEVVLPVTAEEEVSKMDEKELKQMKDAIRKIHVRAGHPSNRALVSTLKARGVDPRVLVLAREFKCDDCMEVQLPVPHRDVSLHQSEVLWHTLQADLAQLNYGDEVIHFMLMIDEASRFCMVAEVCRHHKSESRNATTEEAIRVLETFWVQVHGYPNVLRTDPEGCFRGNELASWCASRGIDLQHCPGEDHGQIGIVEATIGKIKQDARALLRGTDFGETDPFKGILHVVQAHNHMDRIAGFAPAQWAYGRLPSEDGRLFEGGNALPVHSSEGIMGTDLRANLQIRVKAEEIYRKSQAVLRISRALNTKPRRHQVFIPGDLVYYRRYKVPMGQAPSHAALDGPKFGLARWYGPGRVLATETRSELDPSSRKPGSTVWVIAGGRLKRCSPQQLRHCSEREKLLAEASGAISTPGSFTSLLHLVEKGQFEKYDDHVADEENPSYRSREFRPEASRGRSRSRTVAKVAQNQEKSSTRPQQEVVSNQGQAQSGERHTQDRKEPPEDPKPKKPRVDKPSQGSQSAGATASSSHGPLHQHPMFQAAQARLQPKPDDMQLTLNELLKREKTYVVDESEPSSMICHIEVAMPDNKKELKKFSRDSETWVMNKMKKQAEIKWKDIPRERLADFQKAKDKEINQWLQQGAVKLASKTAPPGRLIRMRWLYTIKQDGSAKARIVLIGYEDPDLGSMVTASPTMSRRTRGLFLTACAYFGGTALKGDVRAAFLQGKESELERELFAKPVKELCESLGGGPDDYVQIVKACYGLANAPARWYESISETMKSLGFEQLETEPCCWRFMSEDANGERRVVGLAVAHVDDFLFAGDQTSAEWQTALQGIYNAYQWSPWEVDSYYHCGVQVLQQADGSSSLCHSKYCESIEQIQFQRRDEAEPATESEKQQLRGVLGALQWRAYQTGPQHSAKLSFLQSQLSTPTVKTLMETNKLVREVYNNRHVGVKYHRLDADNPLDITFVAWTDAAVGNRSDMSSTGGYVIAATEPSILQSKACPLNMISWKSGKLPRIARSSLSAEIQAFSIAEEELMFVRLQWSEMMGSIIPMRNPSKILQQIPGVMVTDSRSLYDVVNRGAQNSSGLGLKEKYSVLDMLSVMQRLRNGATITRWVHSEAQIADAMTKHCINSALVRVLIHGMWTLVHDETFTSSKNLRKQAKMEVSSKIIGVCESVCYLEPCLPPLPSLTSMFG